MTFPFKGYIMTIQSVYAPKEYGVKVSNGDKVCGVITGETETSFFIAAEKVGHGQQSSIQSEIKKEHVLIIVDYGMYSHNTCAWKQMDKAVIGGLKWGEQRLLEHYKVVI